MKKYLVAGRQPWNKLHFQEVFRPLGDEYFFCASSDGLTDALKSECHYRYIFFLHWSDRIPESILDSYECVCFHMTDVPYGRGGSPLQNLIARGHRETTLTALRMTTDFDAGPVYLKRQLSLEGGTAEEIYQRASRLSCKMALEIAENELPTMDQIGNPVLFQRRRPEESRIPTLAKNLLEVFDHIRMLDATGYPKAFVDLGNLRLEFERAALYHDGIKADVRITLNNPRKPNS